MDYNVNIIPIKVRSTIEMLNINNYNKIHLNKYQCLISILIYLIYRTILDITCTVGQLSKQNTDLKKDYL